GLATFWGAHFRGKDLLREARSQQVQNLSAVERDTTVKDYEMLGMFLATTGGGIGLILFAPISQCLGRKLAFALHHIGGVVVGGGAFFLAQFLVAPVITLSAVRFFSPGLPAGLSAVFSVL